ncbi:biotin transporter BioY [Tenggerimyces flavus]|uniref:Biotin transporter n=1 Tax=Tenggerimyces flavus TaxID=1708749 RepID=A0ABV7YN30_9ACTN|nr:biotin transporter BioY [Tenggerimyces flavus]MBM7787358.1 biotin transport system substrate-specific component [Tenggerimyces flavus]
MSSRRLVSRDLALIALFAALIAALGLPGTLYLFGGGVPITAQALGVMLAGSILGARRGALAVLVLLALVAAGLPLLAGGRGGLGVFAGLSAGYLIGWPLGAFVTGWLTERTALRGRTYSLPLGLVANLLGGIGVVYAIGIPVQAWLGNTTGLVATAIAAAVFLPGDLIKATIATVVAKGVHTGYPTLGKREPTHSLDDAPPSGS